MVRVPKAELNALIDTTAALSRDMHRIITAVRSGDRIDDVEVEITGVLTSLVALSNHLRELRQREGQTPVEPRQSLRTQ